MLLGALEGRPHAFRLRGKGVPGGVTGLALIWQLELAHGRNRSNVISCWANVRSCADAGYYYRMIRGGSRVVQMPMGTWLLLAIIKAIMLDHPGQGRSLLLLLPCGRRQLLPDQTLCGLRRRHVRGRIRRE